MRSKRCGLLTLARCCSLAAAHSASSRCTRFEAEPVGAPRSCFSRRSSLRTSSSVISEPSAPLPSCIWKRRSRSASVKFLLAWETFPLTLSTTMFCLLIPPSRTAFRSCSRARTCSCTCTSSSLSPSSSSSPCTSSQSPSLPRLFLFFLPGFCLGSSCAALLLFGLSSLAGAAPASPSASAPPSASPPSSSLSLSPLSSKAATVSLDSLISSVGAGVGRASGTSSSLGITGPSRARPAWGLARFSRFACSSCSSSFRCCSSSARI
mmetsp:Transcript_38741/g.109549  ORF Transcript_38741/g.109549 Transcript_38741/m.109549 type:complete len:265 (-) Transcript_38741:228-1022(-)